MKLQFNFVTVSFASMLTEKLGLLFVGQYDQPFASIKYTKYLKELDGKIIECKFENNSWTFMRERTDKSFPNSHNTAMGTSRHNLIYCFRLKIIFYRNFSCVQEHSISRNNSTFTALHKETSIWWRGRNYATSSSKN